MKLFKSEKSKYALRVEEQINQYKNVENMHSQLASVFSYWQQKYFHPRFRALTGVNNHLEFYAKNFSQAIENSGNRRVASLGSGDGAVEVQIAETMIKMGFDDFEFHLIELSPIQNERALKNAAAAGLSDKILTAEADFNLWRPNGEYAGIMAHHALHHVVELEHLFDAIWDGLHDDGVFVTIDVIGRNGHMRWPEALRLIELIWRFLPEDKRYHHILKRVDDEYYNHDCSDRGFEGVRAQDILPLLVRKFQFSVFYGFGNLIDIFTSRGYGANFDPEIKEDAAFIDFIDELNDILIEVGYLKPTRMIAAMGKKPIEAPRLYKGRTPEMMLRDPSA